MVEKIPGRLSREDWLRSALETMRKQGVDGVKVAPLAARMGVTTGSFYWHFKNRRELLNALLDFWERSMTDSAIEQAKRFEGSAKDRILFLMKRVMVDDLAGYDLPIWHWAQSDVGAGRVFQRALGKRFSFATWMFQEAGFPRQQAEVRGRMMVVYLMGESTLVSDSVSSRTELIKQKHAILTTP
jgi:AcrR family transcriptional regulator